MLRLCPRCHKDMVLDKEQRVVEPGQLRVVRYWRWVWMAPARAR